MRIPETELHQSVLARLNRLATDRNRAQESLASQKRLLQLSDDPAGAARTIRLRTSIRLEQRFADNAAQAVEWNDFAGDVLGQVSDMLARARELTIQGSSAGLGQADRVAIADELDALLDQAVELANTSVAGRALFGGGSNPPVVTTDASGSYHYSGAQDATAVSVGAGLTVDLGLPADEVFLQAARRATRYTGGDTGVGPGTGTDSATGFGALEVRHTATTLGDGLGPGGGDSVTGLGLGASSAAGDTLLGAHTVEVRADGTVTLDGGSPVAFTAADTDLAVAAPGGEVVHLDLSGVASGAAFTLGASGAGTLSVDGGATTTAIDFSQNQVVRDGASGAVTQVDTTAVRRAGTESLTYAGTFGVLGTLAAVRDDLRNERGLSTNDQLDELSAHLDELDAGEAVLARSFARVGAASARADTARETAGVLEGRFDQLRSRVEDLDLAEAILDFQRSESAYEASLQATAQARGLSLLSFLR